MTPTRRDFLKAVSATLAGLMVPGIVRLPTASRAAAQRVGFTEGGFAVGQLDLWITRPGRRATLIQLQPAPGFALEVCHWYVETSRFTRVFLERQPAAPGEPLSSLPWNAAEFPAVQVMRMDRRIVRLGGLPIDSTVLAAQCSFGWHSSIEGGPWTSDAIGIAFEADEPCPVSLAVFGYVHKIAKTPIVRSRHGRLGYAPRRSAASHAALARLDRGL